jgi:hypothetical protein
MSDTILAALIGGVCGVLGGVIVSLFTFKTQKPLSEANAAQIIQAASAELIESVQKSTTEQLRNFDLAYRDVVRGSWALHQQVKDAGQVPIYTPPAMPKGDMTSQPKYGGWRTAAEE